MSVACWPCRDRSWQSVDGQLRPCPRCAPADPEAHARGYGGKGTLSSVLAVDGTPAQVSQSATDLIVAITKARLEQPALQKTGD